MKTKLITTTALVGASLFAAPLALTLATGMTPALAVDLASEFEDGAPPVVQRTPVFAIRLAGRVRVEANWVDQDEQGMRPAFRTRDLVDLAVVGTASADNGLSYGFNYDVDQDRGEVFLSNRWGRLAMGNTYTATDSLDVGGSSVLVGRGHWLGGGNALVNGFVYGVGEVSHTRPQGISGIPMGHKGGSTIRYSTPNYGGLTVAVSYTQETHMGKNGSEIDGDGDPWFDAEEVWSIAGQYTSSYGQYTTVVYAGYEEGNRALKDSPAYGSYGSDTDTSIFSVGAKAVGMGFAVGGAYGWREGDGPGTPLRDDFVWFDVAASFSQGPWTVSGGFATIERDDSGVGSGQDQTMEVISITGLYRLAPGLTVSGGASIFEIEDADTAMGEVDNDATTITVSSQMVF